MAGPDSEAAANLHVEASPNGRYIRYHSVLGKGAYKTVYKAFDTEEALEVAWNKLHVDRLSEHDLEKVSNEVALLRRVEHKNIIHFYDTWRGLDGNDNQTINFITEQMMSGTLKEYLKKAKAIKLKVIRRWCSNILEAIAYLHNQTPPIMHRDLKCDNIFINGHVGEVKIGDLGLSGVKEREKADSVIGTPEFMAPELYEESYTEKVDIYAFGMCLLEIVSMEYPYSECKNMAQIFRKVFSGEKPHAFDMLVDGAVKDVIAACLQREARRPSATDLLSHPLFRDWEQDDGSVSNLSLVKGIPDTAGVELHTDQTSQSIPMGMELIDWSDPLQRNVLVSMIEGEGGVGDEQQVSVVASNENGGFSIGLEIPIRDAIKRVEFTFDPFEDNSRHIAQEMVSEFGLGEEQLNVIREEIDRQVRTAKEQREIASRNATPQPAPRQTNVEVKQTNSGGSASDQFRTAPAASQSIATAESSGQSRNGVQVPPAPLASQSSVQTSAGPSEGDVQNVSVHQSLQTSGSHSVAETDASSEAVEQVLPVPGTASLALPPLQNEIVTSEKSEHDIPESPMDHALHLSTSNSGLPHASSFLSTQAHSSTSQGQSIASIETPSGALSPELPQEVQPVPPVLSRVALRQPLHNSEGGDIAETLQDFTEPASSEVVESSIPTELRHIEHADQSNVAEVLAPVAPQVQVQAQSPTQSHSQPQPKLPLPSQLHLQSQLEPQTPPQPAPQSRPELQPRLEPQPPPQSQSQLQAQPQLQPQMEPQLEPQPRPQSPPPPRPHPQSEPQPPPPPQLQSQPQPQSQLQSHSQPQLQSQSQSQSHPQVLPQEQLQPRSQLQMQSQLHTQPRSQLQSRPHPHSQPQPQQPPPTPAPHPQSQPRSQPRPQTQPQSHPQSETQSQAQSQSQTKTLPETQPVSHSPSPLQGQQQSELYPQAHPQAQSQAQPQVQPQPQLQSQRQSQSLSQPEPQASIVQPQSQSQSQSHPHVLPQVLAQEQPQSQLQSQPQSQLKLPSRSTTTSSSSSPSQLQTQAQVQVGLQTQLQSQPQSRSQSQPQPKTQLQPLSQSQPQLQPQQQRESELQLQSPAQLPMQSPPPLLSSAQTPPHPPPPSHSQSQPEPEPRARSQSQTQLQSQPGQQLQLQSQSQPQSLPESQSQHRPQSQSPPESQSQHPLHSQPQSHSHLQSHSQSSSSSPLQSQPPPQSQSQLQSPAHPQQPPVQPAAQLQPQISTPSPSQPHLQLPPDSQLQSQSQSQSHPQQSQQESQSQQEAQPQQQAQSQSQRPQQQEEEAQSQSRSLSQPQLPSKSRPGPQLQLQSQPPQEPQPQHKLQSQPLSQTQSHPQLVTSTQRQQQMDGYVRTRASDPLSRYSYDTSSLPAEAYRVQPRREGHFALARHIPQSVSDGQLPQPASVTVVEIPARPPSTPITPASSGIDLSEDHRMGSTKITPVVFQASDSETVALPKSAPPESYAYVVQSRSRDSSQDNERPPGSSLRRPTSGGVPAIVVVGSNSGSPSGESSRRKITELSAKSLPDFGSGAGVAAIPYTSTQANDVVQVTPGRRLSNAQTSGQYQAVQDSGALRNSNPAAAQRTSPANASVRTSSWKSSQSDDSGNNLAPRVGSGTVLGDKYDHKWYTMCLELMDHCANGRYKEVLSKLGKGMSATFADYDKRTPLHLACAEGHLTVCTLLIDSGADVNAKDRWGNSPLMGAVGNGHTEVQALLKAHGAYSDNPSLDVKSLELMQYVSKGDLDAVREKFVAGASAMYADYDKRTPLHLACSEGHVEIAELLLVNGASASALDRMGRSPVDDAVSNGHRTILRILRQYGAVIPPHLYEAQPESKNQLGLDLVENAARGRVDAVKECLSNGANPNYCDYDSRTALHLACADDRLEVVRVLLQAGANLHAADRWGSTPMDEAAKGDCPSIVEELNKWELKRNQRQPSSVSFDQTTTVMNGHEEASTSTVETDRPNFEHMTDGIATSASMGALPNINLSADDFAAKYPSSSGQTHSSSENTTTLSLPQTSFDRSDELLTNDLEDQQRILREAYDEKKQRLEESHRRALEGLQRKRSVESTRSSRSSEGTPVLSASTSPPTQLSEALAYASERPMRGIDIDHELGASVFSSISNGTEQVRSRGSSGRYNVPSQLSRVTMGSTSTSPIQVIHPDRYHSRDRNPADVDRGVTPVNPDIRLLVDGLIDEASREK